MAQINKSSEYFNTALYTGNYYTQSITGVNFQPDLVYVKGRNTATRYPTMFDSVRGATKRLTTHSTNAEDTHPTMLTSFDSDGWTTGADDQTNGSSETYVSWNWLAGGTAVSNTDGDMTSSVSANTTSGFSIATYTGDGVNGSTFGHGLGVAPKVVIIKCRSLGTEDWHFWYNNSTRLNLNNANIGSAISPISTSSTLVTTPSSTNDSWNGSGQTYVSYCFAEKKGFSKFGTYTGTGTTDAPFIYTGFKPAYIVIKSSTYGGNWLCFDNKRDSYNENSGNPLNINEANPEGADPAYQIDFLSNGFKLRNANGNINNPGETMVYMCFAETPLVGTNNTPTTAR